MYARDGMPRKYIRKTQKQSWASQEDTVLLILDGHLSHTKNLDVILKARENFVTLLCLPPHITHKLQPLDVGVMLLFNAYMDQALETWMNNHPGRTVTLTNRKYQHLVGDRFYPLIGIILPSPSSKNLNQTTQNESNVKQQKDKPRNHNQTTLNESNLTQQKGNPNPGNLN
ncbi:hypothetical protein NQ318_010173 [Aromia moschata]|uniref:DDE-1 domain-containing protein n=1 Tax=Aromia moschata TaxID=1265417 RepID=A0AAV8XGD8_9CUCU|nr:hypothetical protein NQ318_010173 [Aromia moschata]